MLDVICSRTFGVVNTKDVRVLWSEGNLYICASPTDITVLACEAPRRSAGTYKSKVGEAVIRFQAATCGSCRQKVRNSPIGAMSPADIIASVEGIGADV